jgi:mono/diheme cytochrome c family protein
MNKLNAVITCFFVFFVYQQKCIAEEIIDPSLEFGAKTYVNRCSLCHGSEGYGDGLMPLSVKNYPETNLYENKYGKEVDSLRKSILIGGSKGDMSNEMPPWTDELTYVEVESLLLFLQELYVSPTNIKELVKNLSPEHSGDNLGRKLYGNYCVLCHGKNGEGDGKMAKIIKDPPPFNLTKSTMPAEYLKLIINRGGAEMKRSERMPPWAGQFNESEINSIVEYIMSLRDKP